MGLTVADLNSDTRLDAYVSDLGDNELLMRVDTGFERRFDSGAARIRSADASDNEITGRWGRAQSTSTSMASWTWWW